MKLYSDIFKQSEDGQEGTYTQKAAQCVSGMERGKGWQQDAVLNGAPLVPLLCDLSSVLLSALCVSVSHLQLLFNINLPVVSEMENYAQQACLLFMVTKGDVDFT